jgi:hypothetical protein
MGGRKLLRRPHQPHLLAGLERVVMAPATEPEPCGRRRFAGSGRHLSHERLGRGHLRNFRQRPARLDPALPLTRQGSPHRRRFQHGSEACGAFAGVVIWSNSVQAIRQGSDISSLTGRGLLDRVSTGARNPSIRMPFTAARSSTVHGSRIRWWRQTSSLYLRPLAPHGQGEGAGPRCFAAGHCKHLMTRPCLTCRERCRWLAGRSR